MKKISAFLLSLVAIVAGAGLALVPANVTNATSVQDGMDATGAQSQGPTNLTTDVLPTVINTMLFIVGMLAVIMIIFSGIRYVTSAGNSTQVTNAKNTIIYSVIGLVIAIFAYAIVNWVVFAATK